MRQVQDQFWNQFSDNSDDYWNQFNDDPFWSQFTEEKEEREEELLRQPFPIRTTADPTPRNVLERPGFGREAMGMNFRPRIEDAPGPVIPIEGTREPNLMDKFYELLRRGMPGGMNMPSSAGMRERERQMVEKYFTPRIPQLKGETFGPFNPKLEMNPLTAGILPEVSGPTDTLGQKGLQLAYDITNAFTGPANIIGGTAGSNPAKYRFPAAELGLRQPPIRIIPGRANPYTKTTTPLALPPHQPKPTFIVGEAGVAENVAYLGGNRVVPPQVAVQDIAKVIQNGQPVAIHPSVQHNSTTAQVINKLRKGGYTRVENAPDGSQQWQAPDVRIEPPTYTRYGDTGSNIPARDVIPETQPQPQAPPAQSSTISIKPGPESVPLPTQFTSQYVNLRMDAAWPNDLAKMVDILRKKNPTKNDLNQLGRITGKYGLRKEELAKIAEEARGNLSPLPQPGSEKQPTVTRDPTVIRNIIESGGDATINPDGSYRIRTVGQVIGDNPPSPLVSPVTGEPVSSIVSAARHGNPNSILGEAMLGENARRSTIGKLIDAANDAIPLRAHQEKLYSIERAKRFAETRKVETPGEIGFYERLREMEGPLPKLHVESLRRGPQGRDALGRYQPTDKTKLTQREIDTLFDIINKSADLTDGEKLRAGTGLAKLLGEYGGHVPQNNELDLIMRVFGAFGDDIKRGLGAALWDKTPFSSKLMMAGTEIANFRKTIMSSMDISAPFRQGIGLIHHYKQWLRSWNDMFKALGSEEGFQATQAAIRSKQNFPLMERSGLELTDLLSRREEMFVSRWAEYLPGVRPSQRAYTAFLNKLRADVFDDLISKAEHAFGADVRLNNQFTGALSNYINTASGRGSLGKFAGAAEQLNNWFFSPKLLASRFQTFNPKYYMKLTPNDFAPEMNFVRKQKIYSLLGVTGFGTSMAGLGLAAGGEVSLNPTSADFMKMKFGNIRVDTLGGYQQVAVLGSRLLWGVRTSSLTGRELALGSRYGYPTRFDVGRDFFVNKASPEFGLVLRWFLQKNAQGGPINWTEEHINRSIPIFWQDLWEISQENPSLLQWAVLPAMAVSGMGVQVYDRQRTHPHSYNPNVGLLGGGIFPNQ